MEQGKGRKDRYTILPERLLSELRSYWREYRPCQWLFFGQSIRQPMCVCTAQWIGKCRLQPSSNCFSTGCACRKIDFSRIKEFSLIWR